MFALRNSIKYDKCTEPPQFHLVLIDENQATKAVDEALVGMQEDEVKKIVAPTHLVKRTGYPSNVDPDSTLVIKMILHKIL